MNTIYQNLDVRCINNIFIDYVFMSIPLLTEMPIEASESFLFQAAIRGEAMRELGVIYNSSYYSISEHPGYQRAGDRAEVSVE